MENTSEKFYLFLLNKKKTFLKKNEIESIFHEFVNMWSIELNFENIFQTLKQQKRIIFLFDKTWRILDEIEWFKLKKGKIEKIDILISFLEEFNIKWYFGLSTAKYYQGNWQSLKKIYILNNKYNKNLKFDNIEIVLLKIPEKYIIEKSIIKNNNKKFSDIEKTILDEIYFKLEKKLNFFNIDYHLINFNTLNLYLKVFNDKKEVKSWILNNFEKKYLKELN